MKTILFLALSTKRIISLSVVAIDVVFVAVISGEYRTGANILEKGNVGIVTSYIFFHSQCDPSIP